MGWSSSLPAAIDQLVLIAQQAPELEGVEVRDGPVLASDAELSVLYIGWTGGAEDVDADAQVMPDGLAGNPDQEQSVIRCTAWVLTGSTGSTDVGDVRRAVYGIVSGLGAAIDRDRTLGGSVMRAAIGNHTLTQQQTTSGTQAGITFEVNTDAFTLR